MIKYLSKTDKNKLKGVALLRLDFNTEDSWRLEAAVPTIKLLQRYADAILIFSHKGRPTFKSEDLSLKPEVLKEDKKKLSLEKDARTLSRVLGKKVRFIDHFRFGEIIEELSKAKKGEVYLLENVRFLDGEEENSEDLAKELASLGDYFVNDAFAVSHRANASFTAITKFLPSYAGLVLEKEISSLSKILKKFSRPFVILAGGGKAHDKLEVLENFRNKADIFLLGGAPANTILALQGMEVDGSLMDEDPKDLVILQRFLNNRKVIYPADWLTENRLILDIGPATAETYENVIAKARTVLWAGPMGFIEKKKFEKGTLAIAKAIAKNRKCFSVTGGGETVMFLKKNKLDKKFSFISTGGGAMLEFLAGKKLPGIEALK